MNTEAVVRLERLLGIVLRAGAVASTTLLSVGLLFLLAAPSHPWGSWMATVGILILIGTPVARVVTSVAQYAAERDWLFAILTTMVLVVLVGSLLVALRG
jgi:uncharacterized membrane protein